MTERDPKTPPGFLAERLALHVLDDLLHLVEQLVHAAEEVAPLARLPLDVGQFLLNRALFAQQARHGFALLRRQALRILQRILQPARCVVQLLLAL